VKIRRYAMFDLLTNENSKRTGSFDSDITRQDFLTPKPAVGIPSWLSQNIQQGAYQAGLVQVGEPMD